MKAQRLAKKIEINHKLLDKSKTLSKSSVWDQHDKPQLVNRRSSNINTIDNSPIKVPRHSQSIDLSSTQTSSLNKTFTTGFNSTGGSSGFGAGSTQSSFKNIGYGNRSKNNSYTRRYGKYKLKQNIPLYDFTGGDSPWLNKAGVNNLINGKEQNFKINYMNYDKEFNSARPVAHTNNRKF